MNTSAGHGHEGQARRGTQATLPSDPGPRSDARALSTPREVRAPRAQRCPGKIKRLSPRSNDSCNMCVSTNRHAVMRDSEKCWQSTYTVETACDEPRAGRIFREAHFRQQIQRVRRHGEIPAPLLAPM